MKAKPLILRKRVYPNGDIVEIKAWHVPKAKINPMGLNIPLFISERGKGGRL